MLKRSIAAVAVLFSSLTAAHAQPLPTDPRLVTGELDNGVRYIVRQNANPPGRATMWLHVGTGSMNETDQQRGIAHFLEHMAFNGSEHFPPGTVVPLFESLGLTFGHDQNAFTSFNQTVYQLSLPDLKPETLDKSLTFLSDIAGHLSLLPAEIDNERKVILEERTSRLGSVQRVQDQYLERLAPGSLLGKRIPIGTEQTIKAFTPQDFRDYYSRWYAPSDMTVIAAADMDPKALAEQIRKHFSGGAKQPAPKDQDAGIKPYEKTRAIVVSDPELTTAEVGMNWLFPAEPPVTTMEMYRKRLVEQMGTWILNRRLGQKVAQGKVAFQSGGADISELFGAGRLSEVLVRGEPGKWKQMLTDLATEVQRARLHGFAEQELTDAKKEIQSRVEQAVQTDPTRAHASVVGEINAAIETGDAITSAEQDLDITKTLLPQITLQEVNSRFAQLFDTTRPLTFVAEIPSKGEVPTEDQFLQAGTQAVAVQPEAEEVRARPTALLERAPEPGAISDLKEDPASHVWSAWLGDNVRLHYRFMDYKKDQVIVTVLLAGGEIQETAESRGITQGGLVGWTRPATSKLSSTDIRDLMTGKKAGLGRPQAGADQVVLSAGGAPEDLEPVLQLAYLMLTDPVIEPAAFEQWAEGQKRRITQDKLEPRGVFTDLLSETLYPPGEARVRPLEIDQIDRLKADACQAWLRDLCAKAPIEVAIVGDIEKDKALDLARRYLGNLPTRDRISDKTLAGLRDIKPKAGPLEAGREVKTQTDQAIAMAGFQGARYADLEDVRLLNVACQILTTRATADIREKQQLAYSPTIGSSPGQAYPYLGVVAGVSPTAPANAKPLLSAFEALYEAFAKDGPTADELSTAKKQLASIIDEQMREPTFWVDSLSSLDYRGRTLENIMGAPEAYQAFTAEQVKAAWNKYDKPDRTFRLWVAPAPGGVSQPDAKGHEH